MSILSNSKGVCTLKNYASENYGVGSKEINRMLYNKYLSGDATALEELVFNNINFITFVVSKYRARLRNMDFDDLVNEGIYGFIKSLDTYDPTKGELTTYSKTWIENFARKAVNENFDLLHETSDLREKAYKYSQILKRCRENHEQIPSDEELMDILKVSSSSLTDIKKYVTLEITSLDASLDDDGKTTLYEVIETRDDTFTKVDNQMSDSSLLIFLKNFLKPSYYYVLYKRVLMPQKETREVLAQKLGVTMTRITQLENKAIEQIKNNLISRGELTYTKVDLSPKQKEQYNTEPIDPDSIIKYMYLINTLSIEERKLYLAYIKRKFNYSIDEYAKMLGFDKRAVIELGKSIEKHFQNINTKSFREFQAHVIAKYQTSIFDVDLENIEELCSNFCILEDFKEMSFSEAEREVNLVVAGYKRNLYLDKKTLYKTFIEHIKEFTEVEVSFLKSFVFGLEPKQSFREKYRGIYLNVEDLILKLECLYYNISLYVRFNFSYKRYEYIKEHYKDKVNKDDIKLLDNYYSGLSHKELAALFGVEEAEIVKMLEAAKNKLNDLYLNDGIDENEKGSIYLDALYSREIKLSDQDRTIATLFYEGESLEDIANRFHLSLKKVQTKINYIERKIDLYRFGLVSSSKYSKTERLEAVEALNLSSEDKSLALRICENNDLIKIAQKTGIDLARIKKLSHNICRMTRAIKDRKESILFSDVKEDIESHPQEQVLKGKTREVMSYIYGIKCEYNEEGNTFSNEQIRDKMLLNSNQFYHLVKRAKSALIRKKLNIKNKSMVYLPRKYVHQALKDEHIPLSQKERETLNLFYGLSGSKTMTKEEITGYYGETESSLRKRIQNAIITILKYTNREISGTILFDEIKDYLKFFPRFEKTIIILYYKEHLNISEIATQLSLSSNQISIALKRVTLLLKDFEHGLLSGLDYDYLYGHLSDNQIAFYGDTHLAARLVNHFLERGLSYEAIIQKESLPYKKTVLAKQLKIILCGILKTKNDITLKERFTSYDVKKYYDEHKDQMPLDKQKLYESYLDNCKEQDAIFSFNNPMSEIIAYDLMIDSLGRFISLNDLSCEDIENILRRYDSHLSCGCKKYLDEFLKEKGLTKPKKKE